MDIEWYWMISNDDHWGDPESAQTTERWKYVGQGRGSYNEQSKLEYVGEGLFQKAQQIMQTATAKRQTWSTSYTVSVFGCLFWYEFVFSTIFNISKIYTWKHARVASGELFSPGKGNIDLEKTKTYGELRWRPQPALVVPLMSLDVDAIDAVGGDMLPVVTCRDMLHVVPGLRLAAWESVQYLHWRCWEAWPVVWNAAKCRKYPSRSTGVQSRVYSYIFLLLWSWFEALQVQTALG